MSLWKHELLSYRPMKRERTSTRHRLPSVSFFLPKQLSTVFSVRLLYRKLRLASERPALSTCYSFLFSYPPGREGSGEPASVLGPRLTRPPGSSGARSGPRDVSGATPRPLLRSLRRLAAATSAARDTEVSAGTGSSFFPLGRLPLAREALPTGGCVPPEVK